MKLQPNKDTYPFPPVGEIVDVAVDSGGVIYHVAMIPPDEWLALRGDLSKPPPLAGLVNYMAYLGPDIGVAVFPAPSAECNLIVRYYPPMVVA